MSSEIFLPGEKVNKDDVQKIAGIVLYKDKKGVERYRRLSLKRDSSVIPLQGPYLPKLGDIIVGAVADAKSTVYIVELNTPSYGIMPSKMCKLDHIVGDVVAARVHDVEEQGVVILTMPRLLKKGTLVRIDPTKIPRLLGKAETMVNMLKDKLGCDVVVGKNGFVWLDGANTPFVIKIINMIEGQSHTKGLTSRINGLIDDYLKENPGARPAAKPAAKPVRSDDTE